MNLYKHFSKWYLILAITLALVCWPVIAQSSTEAKVKFYIQARSHPKPLTIGDQLTMRLEVIHTSEARVALPQVDKEWGAFRVIEQTAPESVKRNDGTAITRKDIKVTVFRPGTYKTPSLVVTHRDPTGKMENLAAPVIQVNFTSVLTDEDDIDLRDLKPQVSLPTPLVWAWILGGVAVAILLVILTSWVLMWLQRRRRQKLVVAEPIVLKPKDGRPPELIAYTKLDWIESLNLPAKQQFKQHYTMVSDCLREYVENRYNIAALEQTTYELHHDLKQQAVPSEHIGEFMGVLSESDLVKFARYQPADEQANKLVNQARAVVTMTTPK